jgi:hypothetical protein
MPQVAKSSKSKIYAYTFLVFYSKKAPYFFLNGAFSVSGIPGFIIRAKPFIDTWIAKSSEQGL